MGNADRPIRRYRRTGAWDYARGASLFITIATAPRRALFGRVVDGAMRLSPLGMGVRAAIEAIPRLNAGIRLFGHVVMPDHVHFNVHLAPGLDAPLQTLGRAIRRFKNHTTKLAKHSLAINAAEFPALQSDAHALHATSPGVDGQTAPAFSPAISTRAPAPHVPFPSVDGQTAFGLWQQGYHDRLCLSRPFIDATERYIRYNPLKWELMNGAAHALRIHEPLDSPRLDPGEYWKGVGNVALLGADKKIVSLRVSRKCGPAQISAIARRMEAAVAQGWIVLSGFISPGEKAVRDMLCANPRARFIRILPACIPNARFRPESRYVPAFAAGRCLEIGMGNDEREFGRAACLDLNGEIAEIAAAGEGLALYWKADGPHRLSA